MNTQNADVRRIFVESAVKARRHALWAQKRATIELRGAHARGATVSELASALGISRTAVYKQLGKR